MKKILVLFAIVLGLTGCSMNVAPVNVTPVIEEEKSNIEWVSNIESRAIQTTLDEVTIEVYRVPMKNKMKATIIGSLFCCSRSVI